MLDNPLPRGGGRLAAMPYGPCPADPRKSTTTEVAVRHGLLGLLFLAATAAAAPTGTDMLPGGGEHDANVPKPSDVLGFQVGTQHVRHDQLVAYFRALAEASERVRLETIGRTHEGREQILAVISSPDNLNRLEAVRERHLQVARGEAEPGDGPAIIWQGYSIHGDESSGSNAALLYAWHLAASRDERVTEMLDDVVVLLDPSLNPDGLARFAAWATSRRGETPVNDPAHREHHQPWPSGRGNHYWFDLNRDWLLLQHPESRHRVAVFNRWRPHVVTDHHEMGVNSTYFFQPGVPERTHPLTDQRNQELTGRIAEYHARRLDEAGRLYYSRETFDDFYYGKGSTYPDITGGVGILFEQATSAGQAIDTPYGMRTFADSVRNQLLTSLSTLEAAFELREELIAYQADFFVQAREDADGAWVVGDAGNPARVHDFLSVLAGHGIRFRPLAERIERDGQVFEPGHVWVVPAGQFQSRLIQALFETRTEFPSHVFYDVSAWTLPLAFDLPYARLSRLPDVGEWHEALPSARGDFSPAPDAVAYAFGWGHDRAPAALQALLGEDVRVMVATRSLTVPTGGGERELGRGAIVVPLGIQADRREPIERVLSRAAAEGLSVHAVRTGLTGNGVDLGSPSLVPLEPVRPLLVTGEGVNLYEAGEVWHLADVRLGLPLTHVERARFGDVNLYDYTHMILVGGEFDGWSEEQAAALHQWLTRGGILVAQQEAAQWATDFRLHLPPEERKIALEEAGGDFARAALKQKLKERAAQDQPQRRRYADHREDYAETLISGTIFRAEADTTHPLAYGIPDRELAVFKNRPDTLAPSDNAYETVVKFREDALLAGYASEKRTEEVSGSAALTATRVGEGLLVRSAIDPLFRGFWLGTQPLMVNALYFGQVVRPTELKP